MNYAILRTKKIKSYAKISTASSHNTRSMAVENANPDGEHKRIFGRNDSVDAHKKILTQLGIKPRKNAVLAIEYLLTFSPEMKAEIDVKKWGEKNLEFFKKIHHGMVLSADIHLDETTPHMHVVCIPLVKKTVRNEEKISLSARDFLGGRDKLQKLQTDYAEAMKPFGLRRGVRGSTAKHRPIKKCYSDVQKTLKNAVRNRKKVENIINNEDINFLNFRKKTEKFKKIIAEKIQNESMYLDQINKLKNERKKLIFQLDKLNTEFDNSQNKVLKNQLSSARNENLKLKNTIKSHDKKLNNELDELKRENDLLHRVLSKYQALQNDLTI